MSDERIPEFREEDFDGGEQVREEVLPDGEEMQDVGEEDDELCGADEIASENDVGEGEEFIEEDFGVEGQVIEDGEEFGVEQEMQIGEEFGAENEAREGEEIGEEGAVENGKGTMPASPSGKRIKEMSIDRLSALPDILLFRILSCLDTKEAAITAVLSKRWQFLWMYITHFKVCDSSNEIEKIRKFVAWVNRTLVISNGKYLIDFEVEFTYDRCFASDVNVWMESAVKNKVDGISLLLNSSSCNDSYTLPQTIFYHSSLTRLWMRGCTMAPKRTINWSSMRRLYLEEMEVPQHVLDKILSGCPDLSNLLLRACWGYNYLNVLQKLDALGVGDGEDGKNEPFLEISAPYTDSIIVTQYPKGRQWRLTNIPSVVKVHIDFNGSDWDASSEEVMSNTKYLLENIQHVKELVLGRQCIEVLSMMAVNGWRLPQSRLETLIVNARSDEHSISAIVALLESSPNLETLVVEGYKPREASVTLGPAARRNLDCELLHLKTVHMTIYPDPNLGGKPMLTVAQILLKEAIALGAACKA